MMPSQRTDSLLIGSDHGSRNRGAADTVESVAAGNVVAVDSVRCASLLIRHIGFGRCDVVRLCIGGFVDDLAAVRFAGDIEVFGQASDRKSS